MIYIVLQNFEKEEIIAYHIDNNSIPTRFVTKDQKKVFKKRAAKFFYSHVPPSPPIFKYKEGLDRYLRFFTVEEYEAKKDFIRLTHVTNGHAGRDRLHSLIVTLAYGITRTETLHVISECEVCQARRTLVTRPIIRPIVSYYPRERYIADLIDFRYYADVNRGYKWMLVVVDSFTKFIWTVPLKEKTGLAVVPAIRSLFMVNGPPLILHTDNGREFCNENMNGMLGEFEVRHVRGRARCPWIQGQVERANQTIKWMIASMLITLDMPGKWTFIREDATYSYNMMRHSTTGNTPFNLMRGLPIRQAMSEEILQNVLHDCSVGNEEEVEDQEVRERDLETFRETLNLDNLGQEMPEEIDNEQQITINVLREDARRTTRTAVDRMVRRSAWRHDYLPFTLGTRVQIRPDLDANERTRVRPLYEHLLTDVYVVIDILQFNRVKLECERDRTIIIDDIDISRIRRFGGN